MCFSPCGSFQSVNVHTWSCQRRWEWWPFSTLPPGSKSSPGWDPPCRGWSRSCDCLKDTPTKLKWTGKSISEPFHPCSSPVPLTFALGILQVFVYQNIPIQRTISEYTTLGLSNRTISRGYLTEFMWIAVINIGALLLYKDISNSLSHNRNKQDNNHSVCCLSASALCVTAC